MAEEKKAEGEKAEKPKKGKEEKAPQKVKKVSDNPDFKYIVHIMGTDLNGAQKVEYALANLKGIGIRTASAVVRRAGIPGNMLIGDLNDSQIAALEKAISDLSSYAPSWILNWQNNEQTGEDVHFIGPDLMIRLRDSINLMKMMRSYKGIRHEQGQRVRGQRTRAHGRTGLAVGVIKKKEIEAAKEGKKEEEKKK